MGGLTRGLYLFLEWLSRNLLPDTADTEWLDRHADIWLEEGRKPASFASGTVTVTGSDGSAVPTGARLVAGDDEFEVTAGATVSAGQAVLAVQAVEPGAKNLDEGTTLELVEAVQGIDSDATVDVPGFAGGAEQETDDDLRARVIARIQQPPHGGAAHDFVAWALQMPGVTRAWTFPLEMGVGTVTVRFVMDDGDTVGIPDAADLALVKAHIDGLRPVAVVDFFVEAPVPVAMDITISNLASDTPETRGAIDASLRKMLRNRSKPGQTIYRAWMAEAISIAAGEDHHDLTAANIVPANDGEMVVMGTITYA